MGNMKKAIGGRQTGKTTKLIKLSAEKQIPILTTSISNINMLKKMAERMEVKIPNPLSTSQILSDIYIRDIAEIPNVIVDDTELVLKELLGARKIKKIEAISICTDDMTELI